MDFSSLKVTYYRLVLSRFKRFKGNFKSFGLYFLTLWHKRCYFGPFTGEFGHLIGHNLPFIAHLYSKGVKVDFCGMEIYRPFFVDENGKEIVSSYLSLRDFFKEQAPDCNKAIEPADVSAITSNFVDTARKSKFPYWNNSDHFYYFESFRWWVLKNNLLKTFDLSKVYKTEEENSVVIFPRKVNVNFPDQKESQLRNNGEAWDYLEVAKLASKYFNKVYLIGHPAFSMEVSPIENIEVCLTNNNALILEKCSNCKLIISQHSGSVYLGEYTNTPVLIIYKGGYVIGDIEITRQFKKGLGKKFDFYYAFDMGEIENYLKKINK